MKKIIIGSHLSMKAPNYLEDAINNTIKNNANALMIYTGAPHSTIRVSTNKFKIDEGHKLMKKHNLNKENLIIHAPYIINLANPVDKNKWQFGIDFLVNEVQRAYQLGSKYIVIHPGSSLKESQEKGIKKAIEAFNYVIKKTKNTNVILLIETMTGKGGEIGRNFKQISQIIENIIDKSRIGVCFDTCHVWDAGYDIKNDFTSVLNEFDQLIGLNYLKVIHINDSKNQIGSKKDRHENIGKGFIGFDAIKLIIHHPKLIDIPKILETPLIKETIYKEEIEIL